MLAEFGRYAPFVGWAPEGELVPWRLTWEHYYPDRVEVDLRTERELLRRLSLSNGTPYSPDVETEVHRSLPTSSRRRFRPSKAYRR